MTSSNASGSSPRPTGAGTVRVGWIGAGRMGAAMVRRLLDAGHDVAVWNRTRSKAEALVSSGATVVTTLPELADRDVVFTTVGSSQDLLEVLTGDAGLLSTPTVVPGLIVDCSTVSLEASARTRTAVLEAGSRFLAAPVSGNPKVIDAGGLIFAVSGDEADFVAVEPLLLDIGKGADLVGPDEAARIVKLCHNLYLGIVIQGLAEVTLLAQSAGATRESFLAFLNASAMGSMFSRYKSPALVNLDFEPTFTMTLLKKDLELGLAEAESGGMPMPVSSLVHELVTSAIAEGLGELDFAALLQHNAAQAGLQLQSEEADIDSGL